MQIIGMMHGFKGRAFYDKLTQWKAVNLGWIYEDEEDDGVQEVGKRLTNLAGRSALTWRKSRFGTRGWSLCKVHNGYIYSDYTSRP